MKIGKTSIANLNSQNRLVGRPTLSNASRHPDAGKAYTRLATVASFAVLGGLFACGGGKGSTPAPRINPMGNALVDAAAFDAIFPSLNGRISLFIEGIYNGRIQYNIASEFVQFERLTTNQQWGSFQHDYIAPFSLQVEGKLGEIKLNLLVFLTGGDFESLSPYGENFPYIHPNVMAPVTVKNRIIEAYYESVAFTSNVTSYYENLVSGLEEARTDGILDGPNFTKLVGFLNSQIGFLIASPFYKGGEIALY